MAAIAQPRAVRQLEAGAGDKEDAALSKDALAELLVALGDVELGVRDGHAPGIVPLHTGLVLDPLRHDIVICPADRPVALENLCTMAQHIRREHVVEDTRADHGVITVHADLLRNLLVGDDPADASAGGRVRLGNRVGDDRLVVHVEHGIKILGALHGQIHLVAEHIGADRCRDLGHLTQRLTIQDATHGVGGVV